MAVNDQEELLTLSPQQLIDRKWMAHALSLADKAEALDEIPVGAVLVKDNQVVAEGLFSFALGSQ